MLTSPRGRSIIGSPSVRGGSKCARTHGCDFDCGPARKTLAESRIDALLIPVAKANVMPPRRRFIVVLIVPLVGSIAIASRADEPNERSLERRFDEVARPFLKNYCLGCHGAKKKEGKLDLSGYSLTTTVVEHFKTWDIVLERLEAEEMPPEEAKRHPKAEECAAVVEWIKALREREAKKNAGDPGPVLARRLSNAEYDRTIRDLTGADIRPTKEFPIDPANEAGFDNSGESLTMSPALLKKLLEAARNVADHLVLKPNGFDFAPHAAITDVDRDKYCVRRIIDFYKKQRVDYADYFLASWRFQHREALGKKAATLETIGEEAGLSVKYLQTIWSVLTEPQPELGPLGELRDRWRKLPADAQKQVEPRRDCERLRDFVVRNAPRVQIPREHGQSAGDFARESTLGALGQQETRRESHVLFGRRAGRPAIESGDRDVLPGIPRRLFRGGSRPLF